MLLRNNSLVEEIQDSVASNISGGVTANDFNGDGRSDLALIRPVPGAWQWLIDTVPGPAAPPDGIPDIVRNYGVPGDFLFTGDYNGDGSTDIGFIRLGVGGLQWNIDTDLDGLADIIQNYGVFGDTPSALNRFP